MGEKSEKSQSMFTTEVIPLAVLSTTKIVTIKKVQFKKLYQNKN